MPKKPSKSRRQGKKGAKKRFFSLDRAIIHDMFGGMEPFTPLFQAVIAFCAVFTALGLMFNILLKPVKENMARLEKDMKENLNKLESNQGRLEQDIKNTQTSLEEVNTKLDKLLARSMA